MGEKTLENLYFSISSSEEKEFSKSQFQKTNFTNCEQNTIIISDDIEEQKISIPII